MQIFGRLYFYVRQFSTMRLIIKGFFCCLNYFKIQPSMIYFFPFFFLTCTAFTLAYIVKQIPKCLPLLSVALGEQDCHVPCTSRRASLRYFKLYGWYLDNWSLVTFTHQPRSHVREFKSDTFPVYYKYSHLCPRSPTPTAFQLPSTNIQRMSSQLRKMNTRTHTGNVVKTYCIFFSERVLSLR